MWSWQVCFPKKGRRRNDLEIRAMPCGNHAIQLVRHRQRTKPRDPTAASARFRVDGATRGNPAGWSRAVAHLWKAS
ncbi:hypothetical protein BP6252_09127 [Coleophoma cylindrospora]|uniref:Uncharacterized protein n=1 Tax=Coleophoma cylindrospora TaxID=1849047 RepID=A0A3D8R1E3_9HELO|nr:hypothetical protein BP6252_09127 [Coleophoma cylindrospora]